jgi:hypothetical protein
MTFDELKSFLESQMRLSHIYQPLLIKSLIVANGSATVRQLAMKFVERDEALPRRTGDLENPRGGVRGVIPSRMGY